MTEVDRHADAVHLPLIALTLAISATVQAEKNSGRANVVGLPAACSRRSEDNAFLDFRRREHANVERGRGGGASGGGTKLGGGLRKQGA